jgi:hypothetical protein
MRGQMCMWAPDRIDKPITSASSCSAAVTICSGVCRKARVDHFHPGVAERPGDDFRAPVVTVEPWFGNDYANPTVHPNLSGS